MRAAEFILHILIISLLLFLAKWMAAVYIVMGIIAWWDELVTSIDRMINAGLKWD